MDPLPIVHVVQVELDGMTDAAAYFSGPGAVWDLVWIVYGIFCWRVLTRSYFERHVFTADTFWSRANRFVEGVFKFECRDLPNSYSLCFISFLPITESSLTEDRHYLTVLS